MKLLSAVIICILFYLHPTFSQNSPIISEEFIYGDALFEESNAATIVETDSGLVVAWYGIPEEKYNNVEIWLSRKEGGNWTDPIPIANGIQNTGESHPTWHPVLYQVPGRHLLLFYKVGPNSAEWWGMLKKSKDSGQTWRKAYRLPEDILGPISNKPILLPDSTLICPSSTEHNGWKVHFESSTDWGRTWAITAPINDKKHQIIQPSILRHPNDRLQALCRSKSGYILSSWSEDGGKSWSEPTSTGLPNPNAGIDAVTLKNGMQLLVYNHSHKQKNKSKGNRSPLNISISDDGIHWKAALILDKEKGEYSSPAVIQDSQGLVHIVYTWNRQKIKHVVIDPSKLKSKMIENEVWPH
ncbi:sialidase family protein [Flammeovirgaceae bacterium SG7u.111]|nr:sialidase family protein [Flammeovirgaceae bacterium SG7u.132]WPO34308.1 sialidase family protein [Flammeovirgaceae bacterium SG7u.111]